MASKNFGNLLLPVCMEVGNFLYYNTSYTLQIIQSQANTLLTYDCYDCEGNNNHAGFPLVELVVYGLSNKSLKTI